MQLNSVKQKEESEYEDDSGDDEVYLDECGYCDIVSTSYEATIDHQSNYLRCKNVNFVSTMIFSGMTMFRVTDMHDMLHMTSDCTTDCPGPIYHHHQQ